VRGVLLIRERNLVTNVYRGRKKGNCKREKKGDCNKEAKLSTWEGRGEVVGGGGRLGLRRKKAYRNQIVGDMEELETLSGERIVSKKGRFLQRGGETRNAGASCKRIKSGGRKI